MPVFSLCPICCVRFDSGGCSAACPVPIVIAGGKKLPEPDALRLAYNAVQQGAAGVDMGRNIFQSQHPLAMIQAVRKVVHENAKPEEAHEFYEWLAREPGDRPADAG